MIYVVRYALVALYSVFWGSVACLLALFDRSGESGVWAARRWAGWILAISPVTLEVGGLDNLESGRSYVFMSNHQSVFDIVAIVATIPVSFRFVAKRELARIPFFGWGMVAAGHIIIDRSNREAAVRSLKRAAERVRAGTNVIIFPEGTRTPSGSLGAFKSGGFHLAIEAGVPIVPVTVSGSQRIVARKSLRLESGRVRVQFGKPIPTETRAGEEERDALKQRVRQAILDGRDPALEG